MRAKLAVQSNGFTIKRDQTADRRLQLGLACLTAFFPGAPAEQHALACKETYDRRLLLA